MLQLPTPGPKHPNRGHKGIWFSLLGLMVLCAVTFHRCHLPFPGSRDLASHEYLHYPSTSLGEPLGMMSPENDIDEEPKQNLNKDDAVAEEEKDDEGMYLRRSYSDRDDVALARWRGRLARFGDNRRE